MKYCLTFVVLSIATGAVVGSENPHELSVSPLAVMYYKNSLKYATGNGVTSSHQEAGRWLMRAAEAGHPDAQYNLGLTFLGGSDRESGIKWLGLSATNGNEGAAYTLSIQHLKNSEDGNAKLRARHFMRMAAIRGYSPAQYYLAVMYEHGIGGPADAGRSRFWVERSAEQNFALADLHLARMLRRSAASVPDRETRCRDLLRAAAGQNLAEAQYELARHLDAARTDDSDVSEIVNEYRTAAENGWVPAQYEYGRILAENRLGVPRNVIEAWAWLSLAAANRHLESSNFLSEVTLRLDDSSIPAAKRRAEELRVKPGVGSRPIMPPMPVPASALLARPSVEEPPSVNPETPEGLIETAESKDPKIAGYWKEVETIVRDEYARLMLGKSRPKGTDSQPEVLVRFRLHSTGQVTKVEAVTKGTQDSVYRLAGVAAVEGLAPFKPWPDLIRTNSIEPWMDLKLTLWVDTVSATQASLRQGSLTEKQ